MAERLSVVVDELLSTLPTEVAEAAELLSASHWMEDHIAHDLVRRFSSANGTTVAAVAEVKRLPFVSSVGGQRWKVGSPLGEILRQRLEERPAAREVDAYLAERLTGEAKEHSKDAPVARRLQWRAIYHRASPAPVEALDELTEFVDRAASRRRLADLRAAVHLTELRGRCLRSHDVEVSYIVGRSAYAFDDLETAENRFAIVWEADTDAHRKIVAGHLLGVIWSKRNKQSCWGRAERILSEAAALANESGDRYGESVILTSLGSVQSKIGGDRKLAEAEQALRRSLEISDESNSQDQGLALGALGSVIFLRDGSRKRLLEAEDLLRKGIERLPERARGAIEDRLVRVLGRIGGAKRLREAEDILASRLEREADPKTMALTLHMLAQTQLRIGTAEALTRADEAVVRSIELGKETGQERHTAMALLTGSFIAEKSGDLPLAILRMEEVIAINEELGLLDKIEKSKRRLASLRGKGSR